MVMNNLLSAVVFSLSLIWGGAAHAAPVPPSILDDILQEAETLEIGSSRAWKKLLFISDKPPAWPERSVIDDPRYILTAGGWQSAEEELKATLTAFAEDRLISIEDEMQPARCIFAARFYFLDQKLQLQKAGIKAPLCKKLLDFLAYAQYRGSSLVFSNYYLNNPSSMFGHTFLRLHRESSPKQGSIALLDDAINYAAQVADPTDPLYPVKGLTGLYRGRWALLPYYSKVQEYSNFESRDLYEYDLKLDPEELKFLSLVLWEQGAFYSNYYFLSENCSYQILLLLESVKPTLRLTERLGLSVIPIDTLQVLADAGVLDKLQVRPSLLTRLEERYSQLSRPAQLLVRRMFDAPHHALAPSQDDCDAACRAAALDVLIEWREYSEKGGGAASATQVQEDRRQLLLARAGLGIAAKPLEVKRQFTAPHKAHRTTTFGLMGRESDDGSALLIRMRPALHDVTSKRDGYGRGMGISFLDTRLVVQDQGELNLTRLDLLEITSIPHTEALWRPFAWHFHSGFVNDQPFPEACEAVEHCRQLDVSFVAGPQLRAAESLSLYSMIGGKTFYDLDSRGYYARPALVLGALYEAPQLGIHIKALTDQRSSIKAVLNIEAQLSYTLSPSLELRMSALTLNDWQAFDSGLQYFF